MSMVLVLSKPHRVDLVLGERDVFALGEFVALQEILAVEDLIGRRVDDHAFDPVLGVGIDQMEMHIARGRDRVVKRDRTGHERELEMPFPGRSCCHGTITRQI